MTSTRDRMMRRLRLEGWTILQRAAAAVIAFVIARWIGDHPDVFFAPIAAIVSLNTDVGDRGFNALKLLSGVITGIIVGELALLMVGNQAVALGIGTLLAIALVTIAGGSRLTIAQAAAAAVLTVSVSGGGTGWQRLLDALIGAGVALVFTQVLFTPNPLRLLRRAETQALTSIAHGMYAAADAVNHDDETAGHTALVRLRRTRDQLADIHDARQRSRRVTRHTLTRRGSTQPVVAENENAEFLDLLGDGCVMAVRLAFADDTQQRSQLGEPIRLIAELLERLAAAPGDRASRQSVVDDIPQLLDQLRDADAASENTTETAVRITRLLTYDIMRYAGVAADTARRVMDQDDTEAQVPDQGVGTTFFSTITAGITAGAKSAADRLQRLFRRNPN